MVATVTPTPPTMRAHLGGDRDCLRLSTAPPPGPGRRLQGVPTTLRRPGRLTLPHLSTDGADRYTTTWTSRPARPGAFGDRSARQGDHVPVRPLVRWLLTRRLRSTSSPLAGAGRAHATARSGTTRSARIPKKPGRQRQRETTPTTPPAAGVVTSTLAYTPRDRPRTGAGSPARPTTASAMSAWPPSLSGSPFSYEPVGRPGRQDRP